MAYTRRNSSSPGTSRGNGGGGGWLPYAAGAAAIAALVIFGDGESPMKNLSNQMLSDRMSEVESSTMASAAQRRAQEDAKTAEQIAGDGTGCIRVANGDPLPDGRSIGSVHVGLAVGQRVIDPATRMPLPEGACVQDHLGFVAYIGPNGELNRVYYSPNLVEHKLWTDSTRQVVEGQY